MIFKKITWDYVSIRTKFMTLNPVSETNFTISQTVPRLTMLIQATILQCYFNLLRKD